MTKKEMIKRKQRKEFWEFADLTDARVLDLAKAEITPLSKEEVFVQVKDSHNYWISNYGRMVNNLRKYFYMHKTGNVHYTINLVDEYGEKYKKETSPAELVAEQFLERNSETTWIWHIDEDLSNNYYKNLLWVSWDEYTSLNRGYVKVEDIDRNQEYIPYITSSRNRAFGIWQGINHRCNKKSNRRCYDDSVICDSWARDPELFMEWYWANYYECEGESMAVDKDLLCPGNKVYAPDKCCILPQTLNTMLSNSKKHYFSRRTRRNNPVLPLGVRYSNSHEKYYGVFMPCGGESIVLGYWDTPEEAFAEYKRHKQADIIIMADRYKNKIPKHVYDALLKVDVKPFGDNSYQNNIVHVG